MIADRTAKLQASGRTDPLAWAESRPPESELAAVRSALTEARNAGCRLQLAHLSTSEATRLVAAAREDGQVVAAETCPHFLLLDSRDLEHKGAWAKTAPPLRSPDARERLWQAVADDAVDMLASDHAPWEAREKEAAGDRIWDAPNGLQSLQLMTILTLEAWIRRTLPLNRWVAMTSARPARWLGLYPRKGTLEPGADADVVMYRRTPPRRVHAEDLFDRQRWTPFAGMETTFEVRLTLLRGHRVYEDGRLIGDPSGRFVALDGSSLTKEIPHAGR
jgi:allantoinase